MIMLGDRKFSTLVRHPCEDDNSSDMVRLFETKSQISELSWHPSEFNISNYRHPQPDLVVQFKDNCNKEFGQASHATMTDLFDGWPSNPIENWAVDYNNEFFLHFDAFYSATTLQSMLHVKAYGITTVDRHEYLDSYQQALTMHKLHEGI